MLLFYFTYVNILFYFILFKKGLHVTSTLRSIVPLNKAVLTDSAWKSRKILWKERFHSITYLNYSFSSRIKWIILIGSWDFLETFFTKMKFWISSAYWHIVIELILVTERFENDGLYDIIFFIFLCPFLHYTFLLLDWWNRIILHVCRLPLDLPPSRGLRYFWRFISNRLFLPLPSITFFTYPLVWLARNFRSFYSNKVCCISRTYFPKHFSTTTAQNFNIW